RTQQTLLSPSQRNVWPSLPGFGRKGPLGCHLQRVYPIQAVVSRSEREEHVQRVVARVNRLADGHEPWSHQLRERSLIWMLRVGRIKSLLMGIFCKRRQI